MNRPVVLAILAAVAATVAVPALTIPAQAQVDVRIVTPQRNALGDRDHDGVPNVVDPRNNNPQQAWDRDHDGVPNRYDRYDNRALKDKDRDGVPNAWDKHDRNPYRP
jgi:hypothetical protein